MRSRKLPKVVPLPLFVLGKPSIVAATGSHRRTSSAMCQVQVPTSDTASARATLLPPRRFVRTPTPTGPISSHFQAVCPDRFVGRHNTEITNAAQRASSAGLSCIASVSAGSGTMVNAGQYPLREDLTAHGLDQRAAA